MNSPAFIVDGNHPPQPITANQIDAPVLAATIGEPPRRVGHYFEALIGFWLRHVRGLEVVAQGEQVHDGTRTVGELDFVFRDEADRLCHMETAVKFYLYDPRRSGSHFPGPNTTDDFETKATRLFDHQLPMSERTRHRVDLRLAHVKGCCFVHPMLGPPPTVPERMAPGSERGTWVRSSELGWLAEQRPTAMVVSLTKPFWLTPGGRSPGPICEVDAPSGTGTRMLAQVDSAGAFVDRICVVGDEW
ncbi:MAG: DUF1853 family protein [Actinomycetota bacterium]